VLDLVGRPSLIAVVEDDPSVRVAVQGVLKSAGFSVESFASAEEFLASGQQYDSACIITDLQMPGMSGLELQERLNEDGSQLPIIFISAFGDEQVRTRALKAGALDFLGKPFDDDVLIELVRTAVSA